MEWEFVVTAELQVEKLSVKCPPQTNGASVEKGFAGQI